MHWGVRRYQNEDGSLTPEGQKRYGDIVGKAKKASNLIDKWQYTLAFGGDEQKALDDANFALEDFHDAWKNMSSEDRKEAEEIVESMIYNDPDFGSMIIVWNEKTNDYEVIAR